MQWLFVAMVCLAADDAEIKALFEQQRWDEVARAAGAVSTRTPEVEYWNGVALGRLGRWGEAEERLRAGRRLAPRDERFLIELGGIAFKRGRLAEAAKYVRGAVRIHSGDGYANDFLGTLYFLQGNLEAALKYWNRSGKPHIAAVKIEPGLRTDAVLLDRAFAFAPESTLRLSELRTTEARVESLEVFSNARFGLEGRADGKFDLRFSARERNGWGDNKLHALLSSLRGIGFQAVHPDYFNIGGRGMNVTSIIRWDSQKRRVHAMLASPVGNSAAYRFWIAADARDERWELREPSGPSGELGLRRGAVSAGIASFRSGQWRWSSGGELSHRDYRDRTGVAVTEAATRLSGYQLKHTARVERDAWRAPEYRLESKVEGWSETGRIWSEQSHLFHRLQLSVAGNWLPKPAGDDYAVSGRIRGGKIFGEVPFDELFILGLERDNDLLMRGHVGTREGRKGSAPMGGGYVLTNLEVDKSVYSNGLMRLKVSPFVDTGRLTEAFGGVTRKWLWDTGVQGKLSVAGVGFTVTFGRDLRSGRNVFYVMAGAR